MNAVEDEENGETKDEPEKTDEEPDYTKHDDEVNNPQGCMIRVDERIFLTNIESVWADTPAQDMLGYELIELHYYNELPYEGSKAKVWLFDHYGDRVANLMLKAAQNGKKSTSYLIDHTHEVFVTLIISSMYAK